MSLLLILFSSSVLSLVVIHSAALKFFLYWKYFWLDIPMHIFGGITCALGFAICVYGKRHISAWYTSLVGYVLFTIFIGIAWEVFEITTGFSIIDEYFVSDTIMDLLMDILGGAIGYAIVNAIRKLE
ncbi:MAG: hypothetical protein WAW13_03605 [Minisyncoccia bacterium]